MSVGSEQENMQGGEPEFTDDERQAAVRVITSEWPYISPLDLYEADGDDIENIAVFLQMKLTRCAASSAPNPAQLGERELMDLVKELDRNAEAGLCQFIFAGAREFLKDIRRECAKAGIQGGLTEFKD